LLFLIDLGFFCCVWMVIFLWIWPACPPWADPYGRDK